MNCKLCGNPIPASVSVNGQLKGLRGRVHCLKCKPFGIRFTRWSDVNEVKKLIASSLSVAEALRKMGLRPAGGNYKDFHSKVEALGIDISHFTGQAHLRGKSNPWPRGRELSEILVENSSYSSTVGLKKRLIKEGVLEEKCYTCGRVTWQGVAIPLELDHINGRGRDHRPDNLRLLCPNCHALTPTYRGKNIAKRPRVPE